MAKECVKVRAAQRVYVSVQSHAFVLQGDYIAVVLIVQLAFTMVLVCGFYGAKQMCDNSPG